MKTKPMKSFLKTKALTLLVMLLTATTAWAGDAKKLPYTYGFENNDLTVEGWTRVDCANDSKIQTLLPNSGSYSFNLVPKDSPQYLISPEINSEGNNCILSFYYAHIDEANSIQVGYSTTTNDISAFTWEDVTLVVGAKKLYTKKISAEIKYVAIKGNITESYGVFLDDFTFFADVPVGLPFSEDFENGMSSWQVVNGNANTGINNKFQDTKAFAFWGNGPQYLISPQIESLADIKVSLYYSISDTNYPKTFQVGYSATTDDVSAFTWDTEVSGTAWGYKKYEQTFPAGTKYIAVKNTSNSDQKSLYLDNISIFVDGVLPPTEVYGSSIASESVTIKWTAIGGATSYAYQYKKVGESTWSDEQSTTSTSVTVNDLTPDTDYDVRVKTIIGSDASIYTYGTFTTATALPYEQDFESGYGRWTMVDCDTREVESISQIWGTGRRTQAARDSNVGFHFSGGSDIGHDQYLISPRFSGDVSITMSFYYRVPTNISETIYVGYSTTTNDKGEFVFGDAVIVSSSNWTKYEKAFPDNARYFAIKYTSNEYRLFIDDICFEENSAYAKPTTIGCTALSETEATVAWNNPSGATGFIYQYRKAGNNEWSAENTVSRNAVSLSGLTPNTYYNFRVKALYGNDASTFATYNFQTDANMVDLPYSDDFENGMGGWRLNNSDGQTKIVKADDPHSGKYSFSFWVSDEHQYLISPHFASGAPKKVSFYYQNYKNYPAAFAVGYTSSKDASIIWENNTVIAEDGAWTLYETTIPAEAQYLIICNRKEGNMLFLDDINITPVTDITFSKEGYGTYYNGTFETVLPAGMKAFIMTQDENYDYHYPRYRKIADGDTSENRVPKKTAMMLQTGESDAVQNIEVELSSPTSTCDYSVASGNPYGWENMLHGSDNAKKTNGGGIGAKYYKLSYNSDDFNLAWYWGADNGEPFKSGAHKAWLVIPSDESFVRSHIGLPDGNETTPTSLEEIENRDDIVTTADWYSLDGRKLNGKPSTKGVYVVNGKKVVIK